MSDILAALRPLVDVLNRLSIPYQVGGSVASSALGLPRSTLDVDVVCALTLSHVDTLVRELEATYYIDSDMIIDAIGRRASFNLIHLETMLKVDVFLPKARAFDREAFARHVERALDDTEGSPMFRLSTPEDIVLHKLEWYRLGNEISERQWTDILGVIRVQGDGLDMAGPSSAASAFLARTRRSEADMRCSYGLARQLLSLELTTFFRVELAR